MIRDSVIQTLRANYAEITALGVTSMAIFGSVARGDDTPDSDVDIMVDLDPKARVGLFGLYSIQQMLEGLLNRKVDLITRNGLKPRIRETVIREAIDVAA